MIGPAICSHTKERAHPSAWWIDRYTLGNLLANDMDHLLRGASVKQDPLRDRSGKERFG